MSRLSVCIIYEIRVKNYEDAEKLFNSLKKYGICKPDTLANEFAWPSPVYVDVTNMNWGFCYGQRNRHIEIQITDFCDIDEVVRLLDEELKDVRGAIVEIAETKLLF